MGILDRNMKDMVASPNDSNVRLDVFLSKKASSGLSRESIKRIISNGGVSVNDAILTDPKKKLKSGDTIRMCLPEETPHGLSPNPDVPIRVLFEDESCLFIEKPAGVTMHPVCGGAGDTVGHWLLSAYPNIRDIGDDVLRPGMVHRLDRNTSGVVVIAKTAESFLALKELFSRRAIRKKYVAVVLGNIEPTSGVISSSIGTTPGSLRRISVKGGDSFSGNVKEARTEYRLLERYEEFDLLEVFPKTGRTHQIRIHLADCGHPVFGDRMYGGKKMRKENIPGRQLLHAAELSFELFGKAYCVQSELPADFSEFLRSIDGTKKAGYSGEASEK